MLAVAEKEALLAKWRKKRAKKAAEDAQQAIWQAQAQTWDEELAHQASEPPA